MNSEGIITFPSLHASLGILFAAALWRVRGIKWAALGLNALMLFATPAYGSHYFVDVIAGVVFAALCWIAAARLFGADQAATDDLVAGSRRSGSPFHRASVNDHRPRPVAGMIFSIVAVQ